MTHSRRDFLKGAISVVSLSLAGPKVLFGDRSVFAQSSTGKILVVVQLDGGNDGLNTIVPYTDSVYYSSRPSLAIAESSVLKANEKLGFHPVMTKFKDLFDKGKIAVIQNVGYPTPDLSHFRSRVIYQRADPTTQEENDQLGWLGKYADLKLAGKGNPLSAVNIDQSLPKSLIGDKIIPPSVDNFELYQFLTDEKYAVDRNNQINAFKKTNLVDSNNSDFLFIEQSGTDAINSADKLQAGIMNYQAGIEYAKDRLSQRLLMAAQIISGNLGTELIHTFFGGFDTHSEQKADHEGLLTGMSEGFNSFYNDLVRLGRADDVLVLAFSEFGRRVRENGSEGTDHGASCPMFIMGNAVKGGFYGESPSLTNLDQAGNTKFDIDFRSVYSTVLSDFLQTDPSQILGGKFENLGFINK